MKKTAVEWLEEQFNLNLNSPLSPKFQDIIESAKSIEILQLKKAYHHDRPNLSCYEDGTAFNEFYNEKHENSTDENNVLAPFLSKLDEMIEQAQESKKIFKQKSMVSSELTSEAMAQAYKNIKQLILNN